MSLKPNKIKDKLTDFTQLLNRHQSLFKLKEFAMELNQLPRSYYAQLLKAGVAPDKARLAASSLSKEQLNLIREIWSDWSAFTETA